MGFFTLGNLLTLGIVGLVLVLYRQLDRQSHALNKVHKYADKLRLDLAEFVAEKEAAVKDYGISLDVQQKSAKELMKRLQITNEDLALKAQAVTKIDERLSAYDSSLEELVRMTGRVQENLNRIREESGFVEQVHKKVGEAKEKFVSLEKGLGELERRFERENTDFLEKTAQSVVVQLQARIAELEAATVSIAQRVQENKAALDQAEQSRSEQVSRDLKVINHALEDVMEQIATEADKLEGAALVKLRDQAQRRISQLQMAIEEALKVHQEEAQSQLGAFQDTVNACKEEWKGDLLTLEDRQRASKEAVEQEVRALSEDIQTQREDWQAALEAGNQRVEQLFTNLRGVEEKSHALVTQEATTLEQRIGRLQDAAEQSVQVLQDRLTKVVADAEQRALQLTEERIEQWKQVALKAEDTNRNLLNDLEQAASETKERISVDLLALEQQFRGAQMETLEGIAGLEQQLLQVAEDAEGRVLKLTDERLEHWKRVTAEADENTQQMLSALEISTAEIEAHFAAEIQAQEQRLRNLQAQTEEALHTLKDQVLKAAADAEVKVLEDAGARLEQWKAAAEAGDERSRDLLSAFEAAVQALKIQVNKETAGIEQHLQEVQVHTDEALGTLKSHLVKATEDTQAKIWSDTEARLDQWNAEVEDRERQVRALLGSLEAASAESERHNAEVLAGVEGRVEALRMRVEETATHIGQELERARQAAQKQGMALAEEELEKWRAAAQAAATQARQDCSTLEASFDQAKQQVSGEIAGVLAQCQAVQDHTQETLSRMEAALTEAALSAEEKAHALVDTGVRRWEEAAETGDAKARSLLAEVERVSAETKARVLEELAAAKERLESLGQGVHETARTIEAQMRTALEEAKDRALALAQGELDHWNRSAEAVHTQAAALDDHLARLSQEGERNIEALESRLANLIAETEQRFSRSSEERQEQWKALTAEADAQTRAELAALAAAVEDAKTRITTDQGEVQARLDVLQQRLDETAALLDQGMEAAVKAAEERGLALAAQGLEQWKRAVETEDAAIQGLLAPLRSSFEETKEQIHRELSASEARLDTFQQRLDETAAILDQGMEAAVKTAEERGLALAAQGLEQWKRAVETEDAAIQGLLTELKASGEAGKEQIHQELSQAATRLDDFRRRLDETASIMNQGMAEALNAAQERARALADTELEGWQESLETGLAKTKGMLEAMEASFEQTKQEIADELTLTDERMDRIQQALEEASALIEHEMAQALENAADKAFVMADERFQTWQESAREEEAKTKALLEGLEASFGEAKQGLAQELADTEARMDTLKQRLDEAAALIEHEMAKAVGNAEAKGRSLADAALEQWKAAVEGEYAKTQGVLDGLEGSLAHTTAQAEAAMTGIGQQLEALQGRLQDAAAHIEQTMSQAVQQAEAKAAVLGDAHFEAWNQGVAEKEAAARQTLADTEAAFAEAQQRFQVLHQEIQEAAAHIEQTLSKATEQGEAAARATAEERLEQWRQAVAAQDLKTQGLLKALESASEDTKTKAADVYAAIETRLTELRASADETLDLLKTQVAETLRDTEQQILAEAKAHLDPWKAAIGEADSKAQDVLAALQGAAEETKVRLDTEGAAMEQRLTAFRAFADEAYLNLTTQIEQKLQTTEQQAGEHTDAAIKAWTETLMAEDLQVRTALSGLEASFAETKQQVETLQRQVGEAASKLEETMTQVLDTTEAKARLIADTGLSQWKSALETEQERATALLSRLEAVSTETKTQIAAEQAALEQQLQEAHRYTDEAVRTLQAEIAQTVKETEERAREEAQTQIAQWRQTIEEEETKTRTVFESMEGAFGDMQLKTAKEFTSAEERFKTLQDKIAEVSASMETELARTMEQAEAKARAATNQGMEQWKSAVETSKAEIQGLLAELAASSEEIDRKVQSERESLKGRLAELQTYTDDRLAQMKLQLQEVAETREQQVLEEADAKFEEYRRVQAEQFRRMETLADDSQALDAELRRYIQDLENRLREDFARFETQAVQDRDRIVQDFTAASQSLNTIMAGMESELAALKTRAYENVSEKLQVFEDAFATDLTQRNEAIDTQLTAWQQGLDTRLTQLGAEAETQRTALQAHFIETLRAFQAQVQQDMDGAYQKTQEVLEESDRRLGAIREAVEEVTTQTKLIDKAQELKQELEQRIEALKKDLDQLDKHWTEAADIEDEFVKIKRLEEDVHAKMTRFLSEKHRIEQIETDFNRLLLVSEAVEDKLSAISNSNDSLQELQIQIRKLTDALNDTEEKYQRLEKKNETLDITNDGIDRNFKALQESERMTQSITQDLHRLTEETEGVRSALHALNQENQQAQATADQLTVLDQSLSSIEERIEQMQKARKWLADIETRLEKLHKEAQEQVKLMGGLMKDGGKQAPQDKGAPPLGVRDNIIRLARLGWTVDEIARAVKCGKGEVELILEIMPKE